MILSKLELQESISFFFGQVAINNVTQYDPYIVSSEEILEIFSKHIDNHMIHTMKIGMFIIILLISILLILFFDYSLE